jgi:DnaJ-class molecular chaperone
MYEDFNYIADDKFLRNYWSQEKVICRKCQGNGKLNIEENEDMISCPLCEETGKVHRHQQKDIAAA